MEHAINPPDGWQCADCRARPEILIRCGIGTGALLCHSCLQRRAERDAAADSSPVPWVTTLKQATLDAIEWDDLSGPQGAD